MLRFLGLHRAQQSCAVAADNLLCSVDHHLRRIRALQVESLAIGILPLRIGRRGKRIGPSQPIPVSDMLADADHQLVPAGPASVHLPEQRIRRRAAGAPFRREQLYQHHFLRRRVHPSLCLQGHRQSNGHSREN